MSDNKDYIDEDIIIDEEKNEGTDISDHDDIEDSKKDNKEKVETQDKKNKEDSDDKEYEDVCYLCKRTESRAGKMINIPGNICICADCMQKTMNSFSSMGPKGFNLGGFDMSGDDNDNPFGNIMGVNIMNFSDELNDYFKFDGISRYDV